MEPLTLGAAATVFLGQTVVGESAYLQLLVLLIDLTNLDSVDIGQLYYFRRCLVLCEVDLKSLSLHHFQGQVNWL